AAQRQTHAPAHRLPSDAYDDRPVKRDQRYQPTAHLSEAAVHGPRITLGLQHLEVAAGAERRPIRGEEHRAYRAITLGSLYGVAELLAQFRCEGVAVLGAAKADDEHRIPLFRTDQLLAHCMCP